MFATSRDVNKMSELSGLSSITTLSLDVIKPIDIQAAVDKVSQETGGSLDYLISNAGRIII